MAGSKVWPIQATVFDGVTVYCRGLWEGLPVFCWRGRPCAPPPGLGTRRQLRAVGMRPAGQDPAAWLLFWHRKAYRRQELAALYRVALAKPVRPMTAGRVLALDAAMTARRTCRRCGQVRDYCVPTSTRQCWECFVATEIAAA
jgi:hypothetical protein